MAVGGTLGGGQIPFLLGALGPMAAAAIVTVWSGGSLIAWIRPVWRWRVPVRWWLYALGLPAMLYAVVSLILQLTGSPVDWSLAVDRLPSYLGTFVFVLFLGGGLEEPGWRGFGLPVLQEKHSPLRATLILGLVWGLWHVSVYGPAGFVVPWVLAFFYTVLWNATRSLGLCILLHASFTPDAGQPHPAAAGPGLHPRTGRAGLGHPRNLRRRGPHLDHRDPGPAGLLERRRVAERLRP